MQPTLCSKCKKNVAVVFISRMNEKGEPVNEGLCLQCAAKLGLPQVEDMMKRMGITPEDLESLSGEMMQAFGGAEELEDLPEEEGGDEDESGKTATFPFLNRLFGGSQTPAEKQPDHYEALEQMLNNKPRAAQPAPKTPAAPRPAAKPAVTAPKKKSLLERIGSFFRR